MKSMYTKRMEARRGYLLLELTLAMVIISIALVAILNAFSTSIRTHSMLNSRFKALLLLEQKVDELESEGDFLPGIKEGIFSSAPLFKWKTEIIETDVLSLYRVGITVSGPNIEEHVVVYLREQE
jgi:type II secretion system protein I